MVVSMEGLVKRGTVFIYRRDVPKRLRGIIGKREIKLSLDTSDLGVAERRWSSVKAKVDQMLAEAEKGLHSPTVGAYKVLQGWRETSGDGDPASKREIGLDFHLTSLLDPKWQDQPMSPDKRAAVEALLKRHENGSEDNPPLTLLFERYYSERKLPAKTKLEWQGVLNRFLAVLGGDRAVRAVPADVRGFKASLLATVGRNGKTLSPGTVKKNLGASPRSSPGPSARATRRPTPLGASLPFAKSDGTEGRLPYSAEDLKLEPPRVSRRLHRLRGWGHGNVEPVLTGSPGTRRPAGLGAPGRAPVAVGRHRVDRREDRVHGGDLAALGPADRAGCAAAPGADDR
jgi:hypothetical protein